MTVFFQIFYLQKYYYFKMSKRSYPSGASKRQKAIVKKTINSLLKLTDFFSSVPPKEETNLVFPISQETITINQQLKLSQNPTLSPNKCFVDSQNIIRKQIDPWL